MTAEAQDSLLDRILNRRRCLEVTVRQDPNQAQVEAAPVFVIRLTSFATSRYETLWSEHATADEVSAEWLPIVFAECCRDITDPVTGEHALPVGDQIGQFLDGLAVADRVLIGTTIVRLHTEGTAVSVSGPHHVDG